MTLLLIAFLGSCIFSAGLLIGRPVFFLLALRTMAMLNTLLETQLDDQQKQQLLIRHLGRLLLSLLLFVLSLVVLVALSFAPVLAYTGFDVQQALQLSWPDYTTAVVLAGGVLPFLLYSFKKNTGDYSEWSKLLHRMLLNHYNISLQLFYLEKKLFRKSLAASRNDFVVVTGLARSGTSALTTLLHRSGPFHSLSYANMPFLLSPNLWKKIYRPKADALKERAHGDRMLFGYASVEALEEYFFKAFLRDGYLQDRHLSEHELPEQVYRHYLDYQQLLQEKEGTVYLAKNNNFLLRYRSLREYNKDFKVVFIFRDPVEHAYSLYKQHRRFSELQRNDPFALEYMDWLAHHEFGLHLKVFRFGKAAFDTSYSPDTLEFWLQVWLNYYNAYLALPEDPNRILIQYEDFLHHPEKVLQTLSAFTGLSIPADQVQPFQNDKAYDGPLDATLLHQCREVYGQLMGVKKL